MKLLLFFTISCLLGCSDHIMLVQGPKGDTGSPGQPGQPGLNGSSCFATQTPTGAVINCSDGSSATISNGADGKDGHDGSVGPAGPAGSPGTQITIVPFCTSTTSYPTTFTEIGFCINNELFGVYSENNGFLVKMPPGNYLSNGHNSSCSFHVSANCMVTH